MLIYATICITLALVLYSVGVWAERIQGELKIWHLVFFYSGLVCDAVGTLGMRYVAQGSGTVDSYFHGVIGALALGLMLVHALWATFVLVKKDDRMIYKFHRFSVVVWIIWLIPYTSGMAFSFFF